MTHPRSDWGSYGQAFLITELYVSVRMLADSPGFGDHPDLYSDEPVVRMQHLNELMASLEDIPSHSTKAYALFNRLYSLLISDEVIHV